MHIKSQTVIPADVKVTRCPPSEGKGRSIWGLAKAEERKLEKQGSGPSYEEKYKAFRAAGLSIAEAAAAATK